MLDHLGGALMRRVSDLRTKIPEHPQPPLCEDPPPIAGPDLGRLTLAAPEL